MTVTEETIDRDDEIKNDYVLLRNYNENILPMREILLKIAMNSISQIEEDKFPLGNFSDKEKIKIKSMFQMDIISGIMMYVEDLAILAESFRRKISYYKLLDRSDENEGDAGDIIRDFFECLNSFSDVEFHRILGYADLSQLELKEEERRLVEKVMLTNIAEIKRILIEIKKFRSSHHPAFRRFKHAGAPLILGALGNVPENSPLSKFDSYTQVSRGKNPLKDMITIPLSKNVLDGYNIIIDGIRIFLQDLVKNHMACTERNLVGILPDQSYSLEYTPEEKKLYEKIIREFYDKHPPRTDDLRRLHFKLTIEKEDIMWYLDLPNFLRECKERKEYANNS